jgi:hypothetical protein
MDKYFTRAKEHEGASPWMNRWLAFDSLGQFLTPGRRRLCQAPRQILDDFVNQETNSNRIDSLLFVFIIRKTLNQRSL